MSAEEYNRIRRIIFSTANDQKKGFGCAFDYLEGYRSALGHKGYAGLRAELNFFQRHGREFSLTVAADVGEHADFSGIHGSEAARFDVTTNLSFKSFSDYEPHMGWGTRYKVAVYDSTNFEIIDVRDLAFKRCACGGYLIPTIALLGQNYNCHSESTWSNDQVLMNVCSICENYEIEGRYTHHFMFSPEEYSDNLPDDLSSSARSVEIEKYCLGNYKYFRREFSANLMAVSQHQYFVTERDGGGHWGLYSPFINSAVSRDMKIVIPCSHVF